MNTRILELRAKHAALDKAIGCGAPVTYTTYLHPDDPAGTEVTSPCGDYFGEAQPWCAKCEALIEQQWALIDAIRALEVKHGS